MFQEFRHIRLQDISDVDYILSPDTSNAPTSLHSPAIDTLTDFTKTKPVTVQESMPIEEALEYMKSQHVRMLFVLDNHDNFAGIVTAADVSGRKVMAFMQRDGVSRDQVQVRHIMLGKLHIRALTYEQIKDAKVGDVMLTLKGSGDQHVVVVDQSTAGVLRIRGVISASDISRRLKIGFEVMYEAKTFAEIEKIVSHGGEL
ncbi:CBS domain-containing protein [Neptuniibacter sp.]|uniref:CBS domain-containing protein n=1 Tax=Neptuniibacter sp. TaxID=1962643 RepID=UPI002630F76B|nr:CBS domain-containing protein [Neptuniibacter sp.]MCP4596737.1 CBS domain-containing protein [Neptuniibacter sp.]